MSNDSQKEVKQSLFGTHVQSVDGIQQHIWLAGASHFF